MCECCCFYSAVRVYLSVINAALRYTRARECPIKMSNFEVHLTILNNKHFFITFQALFFNTIRVLYPHKLYFLYLPSTSPPPQTLFTLPSEHFSPANPSGQLQTIAPPSTTSQVAPFWQPSRPTQAACSSQWTPA